jgi:hypothetical protein
MGMPQPSGPSQFTPSGGHTSGGKKQNYKKNAGNFDSPNKNNSQRYEKKDKPVSGKNKKEKTNNTSGEKKYVTK